jgi:hypothetical protein
VKTYRVLKQIKAEYEVEVLADSPEDAIRKAYNNEHEPGELVDATEEYINVHNWRVFGEGRNPADQEQTGFLEINFGIDRESLIGVGHEDEH